jgi:hypothetical protein
MREVRIAERAAGCRHGVFDLANGEHLGIPASFPRSLETENEGFEPPLDRRLEGFSGFLAGVDDFVPSFVNVAPTQAGRLYLTDPSQPKELNKVCALVLPCGPLATSPAQLCF